MTVSERVLANLQSPDWQKRLVAIHELIDLKYPALLPALVNVLVELAEATEEVVDSEEVGESSEQVICAMGESARGPLEQLRDDPTQADLAREGASYLLSSLDNWQLQSKVDHGNR